MLEFKTPFLLLLLPVLFFLWWWRYRRDERTAFRYSNTDILNAVPEGWRVRLLPLLNVFRWVVLVLMIIALAGPRQVLEETEHKSEGIDIVLSLDISGSMAAEDFKLGGRRSNRLEIIKKVVAEFIEGRKSDRIGLIAFGARAYTVSPMTTDYRWLKENLERVQLGLVEDGTAIGSGLASALGRLNDSKAKSKVVILLTDGMNNAGKIEPLEAATTAKQLGVKVYTIGAGSKEPVPFPMRDLFGRTFYQEVMLEIDETTLSQIAAVTGGKYFRATDTESLRHIYQQIDAMEKTVLEQSGYKEYQELFAWFLLAALGLLLMEILLRNSVFLQVP